MGYRDTWTSINSLATSLDVYSHDIITRRDVRRSYNLHYRSKCFLTYLQLIRRGNMSTNRSQKWITRRTGRHVDGTLSIPKTFRYEIDLCSRASKSCLKAAFSEGRPFASEGQKPETVSRVTIGHVWSRISTMINIWVNYFTKKRERNSFLWKNSWKIRRKFTNVFFSFSSHVRNGAGTLKTVALREK